MRYLSFFIVSLLALTLQAQVGINNTQPKATLQVSAKNLVSGEVDTGFGVPVVNAFPEVNPTSDQNGMLIYLDTTSVSNATGYYYWDAVTTSWEFVLDNVSKDFDTSKTIVLGTKFSTSNIGGGINTANVPFEYITTLDASFELTNRGELKVGKTSTYYLSFSGGVMKAAAAGIFSYSTEILINGVSASNLTSTNSAPAGNGNTRSATFYIATILNLTKNDLVTVRTTKTSGGNQQVSVDTPFTLTLINMK